MKVDFRFLFLLYLASLISYSSYAQWISTNGPKGGTVSSFTKLGDRLFAATVPDQPFSSTNNGQSWIQLNPQLSYTTSCFGTLGGNIFAGNSDGILRSTNNGVNWIIVFSTLGINDFSLTENFLFAATSNVGIVRSTNGGINWTVLSNGISTSNFYSVRIAGSNVFAGSGQYLYRSSNHGDSWEIINNVFEDAQFLKLISLDSKIFAGTRYAGVLLSTNNGDNWTQTNNGLPELMVQSLAIDSLGYVYAGTANHGIYKSTNNGVNWVERNAGIANMKINTIAAFENDIFAGTRGSGAFLSTDHGLSWRSVSNGFRAEDVFCLTSDIAGNLYAGTDDAGVHLSTDNGSNWIGMNSGLDNYYVTEISVSGPNIIAGLTNGHIFLSSNQGTSWNSVLPSNGTINTLSSFGNRVFTCCNSLGIFLSTNYGSTWTNVKSGPLLLSVNSIEQDNYGHVFAASYGRVFFSDSNGVVWNLINNGLPLTNIFSIGICDSILLAGIRGKIYRSTNMGANWIVTSTPSLPQTSNVNIFKTIGSAIVAGSDFGIFLSTNQGANWVSASTGMEENLRIFGLTVLGNYIYAGTSYSSNVFKGCVWKRPLSDLITSIETPATIQHGSFNVSQNFPNPFNPVTMIHFSIPTDGNVLLKIYDVSGKEITTHLNEHRQMGYYSEYFNASNLASGVYYYKLTFTTGKESYEKVLKMMVLK